MTPSDKDIIKKLNTLYKKNPDEYLKHIETLKSVGYRVFRNEKGEHKVTYNNQYLNEIFGGIFGGLFND